MTTIAVRDHIMVSDSCAWEGDICTGALDKLFRAKDGSVWGFAGKVAGATKFKAWADVMEGDPPETKDTEILFMRPDGTVRTWEEDAWVDIRAPYFAIGSGSHIALGAMHMGATAQQAVEAASNYDAFTGGEIVVFELGEAVEAETVQEPLLDIADLHPQEVPAMSWREKMGLE